MKRYIFAVILSLIIFGCATAPKMSDMQKRQIESRDIKGSYEVVFKATMAVLQDNGYHIKNADINSGLIRAQTSKQTKVAEAFSSWGIFIGNISDVVYNESLFEISAVLEKVDTETTRQRMTIQEVIYNTSEDTVHSRNIIDPQTMDKLYNAIQVEVERRKMLNK